MKTCVANYYYKTKGMIENSLKKYYKNTLNKKTTKKCGMLYGKTK